MFMRLAIWVAQSQTDTANIKQCEVVSINGTHYTVKLWDYMEAWVDT
jgi:hypothetical protein